MKRAKKKRQANSDKKKERDIIDWKKKRGFFSFLLFSLSCCSRCPTF